MSGGFTPEQKLDFARIRLRDAVKQLEDAATEFRVAEAGLRAIEATLGAELSSVPHSGLAGAGADAPAPALCAVAAG